MTVWQHKVCQRFAAREMEKYDSTGWLEAKERIAEMINDEFALKPKRTNKRVARYKGASSAKGTGTPAIDGTQMPTASEREDQPSGGSSPPEEQPNGAPRESKPPDSFAMPAQAPAANERDHARRPAGLGKKSFKPVMRDRASGAGEQS